MFTWLATMFRAFNELFTALEVGARTVRKGCEYGETLVDNEIAAAKAAALSE